MSSELPEPTLNVEAFLVLVHAFQDFITFQGYLNIQVMDLFSIASAHPNFLNLSSIKFRNLKIKTIATSMFG
jgi:hypothetical protein